MNLKCKLERECKCTAFYHAIKVCKQGMDGVDSVDCVLSDFRANFSGKRRYWSLIINAFNLGFAYCW